MFGSLVGSQEFTEADMIALKGSELVGSLVRLTKSPRYRDAHPTDDHYFPLLVAAGAASIGRGFGKLAAQTWELQHMCNNQYVWGSWTPEFTTPIVA